MATVIIVVVALAIAIFVIVEFVKGVSDLVKYIQETFTRTQLYLIAILIGTEVPILAPLVGACDPEVDPMTVIGLAFLFLIPNIIITAIITTAICRRKYANGYTYVRHVYENASVEEREDPVREEPRETNNQQKETPKPQKFYCEYCGLQFQSISQMTAETCSRHPNGYHKGRHKLYEGSEKSQYTCKYCGRQFQSISQMACETCFLHPNGSHKGRHAPAL